MYKIISKVLARRLKLVLDKIIDEKQRAFMGGRNMLDNMLVANEEVDDAKRRKRSCLIFKVVFEKAYNCVC